MKVILYALTLPVLGAVLLAQDAGQTQPPPAQPATTSPSTADHKGRAEEMKTQTYSGTLMDVSCASGDSSSAATASSDKSSTSDKSSSSAASQSCGVSSSTTQFALKLKDGRTVRIDDVGNQRIQDALKNKKSWSSAAAAGKPIRVKANGVLSGDRLTTMSVD